MHPLAIRLDPECRCPNSICSPRVVDSGMTTVVNRTLACDPTAEGHFTDPRCAVIYSFRFPTKVHLMRYIALTALLLGFALSSSASDKVASDPIEQQNAPVLYEVVMQSQTGRELEEGTRPI